MDIVARKSEINIYEKNNSSFVLLEYKGPWKSLVNRAGCDYWCWLGSEVYFLVELQHPGCKITKSMPVQCTHWAGFNPYIGPGPIPASGQAQCLHWARLAQSSHWARPDPYIGPGPMYTLGQTSPIFTLGLVQTLHWTWPNVRIGPIPFWACSIQHIAPVNITPELFKKSVVSGPIPL